MDYTKLVGPIVGAVIGYGTNWIAIKMLFRPLKPIKIGKFTLPFTPGIIPKRKDELAKAVGNVVGNNLVTSEDIKELLLSENAKKLISEKVFESLESDKKVKEILSKNIDESEYNIAVEKVKKIICDKIKDGLIKAGLGEIIVEEGKRAIQSKVQGTMLRMFVNNDMIDSIVEPMGAEVDRYIRENGDDKIMPAVEFEISALEEKTVDELTMNLNREKISEIVYELYKEMVQKYSQKAFEEINISQIVENKINQMEPLELEKLILSIMKKELRAIVNLGALIGLVLGSINVFF